MILMQPSQISIDSIQRDGNCMTFTYQWPVNDQVNGIKPREKVKWLWQMPVSQAGSLCKLYLIFSVHFLGYSMEASPKIQPCLRTFSLYINSLGLWVIDSACPLKLELSGLGNM